MNHRMQIYEGAGAHNDYEDSFECFVRFQKTETPSTAQLVTEFWSVARKINPMCHLEFDGVWLKIEGRGEDGRCRFCRYFRKRLENGLGVKVEKANCPFEDAIGAKEDASHQLIGATLFLTDLETNTNVQLCVVERNGDPDEGTISWKSPLARAVYLAGGKGAKTGETISIKGRPAWVLQRVE